MITKELLKKANEGLKAIPQGKKSYIMVNERVKGFRDIEPGGSITTEIISLTDGVVVVKATIHDENGQILATGHAYEKEGSSFVNKTSYIENCETSAVGRALGFLGIGIDDSMASADEVANAILQQNEKKDADKMKESISNAEQNTLVQMCEKNGVDIKDIGRQVGAKSLKTMTKAQYGEALKIVTGL